MAESDAISLYGSGVALQGKPTNYSNAIFRLRAMRDEHNALPKTPLIKTEDFKTLTDNLLPLYNTQATNILKQYANDYTQKMQEYGGDATKASNAMALQEWKYRSALNDINANNENTKNYLALPPDKFLVDETHRQKVKGMAFNAQTPLDQWKLNSTDAENGITAGDGYSLNVPVIPNLDFEDFIAKYSKNTKEIPGEYRPAGNGLQRATNQIVVNDVDKEAAAHKLVSDPDWWANFRAKKADWLKANYPEAYTMFPKDKAVANEQMLQAAKAGLYPLFPVSERLDTRSIPTEPGAGAAATAAGKAKWHTEGNSYSNGQNIWHYDRLPDGNEVFTFSKTNPAENAKMSFKSRDKETGEVITVIGVPVRFEMSAGDTSPKLFINTAANGDQEGEEVDVPYTAYNAAKIKNEYGADPIVVRKKVTGTVEKGTSRSMGVVKDATQRASTKVGASERLFKGINGKTYKESDFTSDQLDQLVKAKKITPQ